MSVSFHASAWGSGQAHSSGPLPTEVCWVESNEPTLLAGEKAAGVNGLGLGCGPLARGGACVPTSCAWWVAGAFTTSTVAGAGCCCFSKPSSLCPRTGTRAELACWVGWCCGLRPGVRALGTGVSPAACHRVSAAACCSPHAVWGPSCSVAARPFSEKNCFSVSLFSRYASCRLEGTHFL